MSKVQKKKNKPLVFDDIAKFLAANVRINQCPSCTEAEWVIHYVRGGGGEDKVAGFFGLGVTTPSPTAEPALPAAPMARPVVPVTCKTCGFMRLYDGRHIQNWVNAQEDVQGGDDEEGANDA